jgi:hypothetical protein
MRQFCRPIRNPNVMKAVMQSRTLAVSNANLAHTLSVSHCPRCGTGQFLRAWPPQAVPELVCWEGHVSNAQSRSETRERATPGQFRLPARPGTHASSLQDSRYRDEQ